MEAIKNTLQGLALGPAQHYRNLTAFPLINGNAAPADYLTLGDAVRRKTAQITEVSDTGRVPELLLDNRGEDKVLILDGEELLGAKQNRIANLTILADAMSKTVIPVSCVEHGRWSYSRRDFGVSERAQFSRGRAKKAAALSANLKATGTYGADQSMVWDDISAKQQRMSVNSPTSSMGDMFDYHEKPVEQYAAEFTAVENQVGVIFAIDGKVEGMDLFDAPDTLARMLPKLTRSFAIDALETADYQSDNPRESDAGRFLAQLALAHADVYPGVGVGTDIRLSAPLVAGGGLVNNDKLVHLAAFSISGETPRQRRTRMMDARMQARRYERMRERAEERAKQRDMRRRKDEDNS